MEVLRLWLILAVRNFSQNIRFQLDTQNIISGNIDQDFNFETGTGAFADHGCAATLLGEMWYFGGDWAYHKNGNVDYRKQVCAFYDDLNSEKHSLFAMLLVLGSCLV